MVRSLPRSPLFPYTTLFRSVVPVRVGAGVDGRGLGERRPAEVEQSALVVPRVVAVLDDDARADVLGPLEAVVVQDRSEEHTSELQSRRDLVCRLLLEKKKQQ